MWTLVSTDNSTAYVVNKGSKITSRCWMFLTRREERQYPTKRELPVFMAMDVKRRGSMCRTRRQRQRFSRSSILETRRW